MLDQENSPNFQSMLMSTMVFLDLFWSHNSLETVIFKANWVLFWRSFDALRGSIWRSLRLLGTFWRALVLHGAHRGSYLALFNAPWHFLALFSNSWPFGAL